MRWMLLLAVGMITACSSPAHIVSATPAYVEIVGGFEGRVELAEEHCRQHGRHAQALPGYPLGRFACVE